MPATIIIFDAFILATLVFTIKIVLTRIVETRRWQRTVDGKFGPDTCHDSELRDSESKFEVSFMNHDHFVAHDREVVTGTGTGKPERGLIADIKSRPFTVAR